MIHVVKLSEQMKKGKGARIGETAVVSKKVHTLYPRHPEAVHIIINADAGKTFYHRKNEDEIVHIDLFHEVTACDVKSLASYAVKRLKGSRFWGLSDFIDIQTGGGGGRLTGSLDFGRGEKLLKNHKNHVHLAALIPESSVDAVFYLVEVFEGALLDQGIELRKIEKIIHECGNAPMDVSGSSTDTDSNLKSHESDPGGFKKYQEQQAVNAMDYFGGLSEIEKVLGELGDEKKTSAADLKKLVTDADDIIRYFEQTKHIEKRNYRYQLTQDGENLYTYIKMHRRELETILKKSIRNLPRLKNCWGFDVISTGKAHSGKGSGPKKPEIYNPEDTLDELDISETVKRSLVRCHFDKHEFCVKEDDIVSLKPVPKFDQDVCLLIDASASMAGPRLRNAKYLAKHLVLKAHRRVSVLAFKEKEVKTYVPFTKSFEVLEEGLDSIGATGLTPLALALDKGLEYMSQKSLKNPLMLLITDGIPTISHWTSDPIKDATRAASQFSGKKIDFCCIGLQPNKECLLEVVGSAKGKLFVVEELNRELLVDAARKSGQLLQ